MKNDSFPRKSDKAHENTDSFEEKLHISHRNLPHWKLQGSVYFVTFRLRSGILSLDERQIVLDAIRHFHGRRYWVTSTVIMHDHVHILMRVDGVEGLPAQPLEKILQSVKGFTAREINSRRGTRGSLWQDESFDRIVRDETEFLEKWNYIRNNPAKVEMCETPEAYPFLWEPGEPSGYTGWKACATWDD